MTFDEAADRDAVVSLLEAAAARLRDKGWRQCVLGLRQGPNCIVGALRWEALARLGVSAFVRGAEYDVGGAEYDAAYRALVSFLGEPPTIWNDHICPDAAAAVDALLGAAKEVAGAEAG